MEMNNEHLSIKSIVEASWSSKVRKLFGSMVVGYRIKANSGIGVKYKAETRFVHNLLNKLEVPTGIDFNIVQPASEKPDILIIFSSDKYSAGLNGFTKLRKNLSKIQIIHGDSGYLMGNFKQLAAHEILHTLGLSHPYGSGSYPGATTNDTLMSYNDPDPRFNGITSLDIAALRFIWS